MARSRPLVLPVSPFRALSSLALGLLLAQPGCTSHSRGPEGGSGGQTTEPAGTGGGIDICGPIGPAPESICRLPPACGFVCEGGEYVAARFVINNPFREYCACGYVPTTTCPYGCDEATGACIEAGFGGTTGEGGAASEGGAGGVAGDSAITPPDTSSDLGGGAMAYGPCTEGDTVEP